MSLNDGTWPDQSGINLRAIAEKGNNNFKIFIGGAATMRQWWWN
jgi:hypothetical protein